MSKVQYKISVPFFPMLTVIKLVFYNAHVRGAGRDRYFVTFPRAFIFLILLGFGVCGAAQQHSCFSWQTVGVG